MQLNSKHDVVAANIRHLLRMWFKSKYTDGTLVPTNSNSIKYLAKTY